MELIEIEKHAKALMTAHGVGNLAFEFDRGKRRIGCTHFKRVVVPTGGYRVLPIKITLSKHFAELLTIEEIRETMLHEIAHALAGREAGHGPVWKAQARALGIKGDRCKSTTARPEGAVKGYCPVCESVIVEQHKLPLRVKWHGGCGSRQKPLKWFKNSTLVALADMPERYRIEWHGGTAALAAHTRKSKSLDDWFTY